MSQAEVLNQLKRLNSKYQSPFGIVIWGTKADGSTEKIAIDDQGRLIIADSITATVDKVRIWDGTDYLAIDSSGRIDMSDRAARLLGIVYGSQGQQLLQRATTYDTLVQIRSAGTEIDPRDVSDRAARLLGVATLGSADNWAARVKVGDGTNLLAIPQAGDAIGRGVFLYGSDYGSPTPYARIVKVDSSGKLSCVLG